MFGRLVSWALALSIALVGLAAAPAQAAGGELRLNPSSYHGVYPVSAPFSPTYRPAGGSTASVPADITYAPAGGGASQPCPDQTCTPAKPGSYTVTATWDGVTTTGSLVVDKMPQDLRLTNTPAGPGLGDSWRPEVATPSSGTTSISAGGYACTYADGVVTIVRATGCTVSVSNPGDDFYRTASISESFSVPQVGTSLALRVDPGAAERATVGVALSVEATITPATDGQLLLTLGGERLGTVRVVGGTATYAAAPARAGAAVLHGDFRPSDPITYRGSTREESLDVALGEKTLEFVSTAPTTALVGDTYEPVVRPSVRTGSIRYGVAAESADVCAWTGTDVRFDRVGTCVVTADQDGDPDHHPAPQVRQVVTVNAAPTVGEGPGDQSVLAGETATFTVAPDGSPTPTVRWERSSDGGDTFTSLTDGPGVTGASGATLRITATQDDDRSRYRAVVTNAVGQVTSPEATLSVSTPASITSPAEATFETGLAGSHTITTAGAPQAVVAALALPTWLRLTDHGDGTATLAGTPPPGAGGVLELTLSATNGAGAPASQQLRLVVDEPVTFTSPATAALVAGAPGEVEVTTRSGYPALSRITADDLPDGLRLTDHGDGTATIAGTPTAAGSTSVTLTASNGAATDAVQSLELLVYAAPTITSPAAASYTILESGSFDLTTSAGHPTGTRLALTGELPAGLRFTDHGDGTASIAGSPAPGTGGTHRVTVTATPVPAGSAPATPPAGAIATQGLQITVARAAQLIALTPQDGPGSGTARVGDTYTPAATSSSGLPVAFAVHDDTTAGACSLDAGTVRFQHVGTCVLDASQPGDDTYAPAGRVEQRIEVEALTTDLQVHTSPGGTVYGEAFTATATVSAGLGSPPAGSVRFSVDGADVGAPVALLAGVATSPELSLTRGGRLAPDAHDIEATFTPADPSVHEAATGETVHVVARAATTTRVQVAARRLVSTTTPVAPGAGAPGGTAEFFVDGSSVGTRPVVDGVATLAHDLGYGRGHVVSVDYSGDAGFSASSGSSSRRNPTITARLSSSRGPSAHGWYRTPVRVTFTCATDGAPLTAPCPSPVALDRNAADQTVTRTIRATDGGTATVVTDGVGIDRTEPRVQVRRLRALRSSYDPDALRCVGTDRLSGVARCDVVTRQVGAVVRYRATSTDRAGNTSAERGRLLLPAVGLQDAPYDGVGYRVRAGRAYTLTVFSRARPQYYAAAPSPRRPFHQVGPLSRTGRHAWSITLHITPAMARTRDWQFGVEVKGRLRVQHLVVTR